MDIKRMLHIPRLHRGPQTEPEQALPAPAPVDAKPKQLQAEHSMAELSPGVLDRVSVIMNGLEKATEGRKPATRGSRPEAPSDRERTDDLMRRVAGGLSDKRVRAVMQARRRSQPKPASRTA